MELGQHDKMTYLRNSDGSKKGVMIAQVDDGDVNIGFSLCCNRDEFDLEFGQQIAIDRSVLFETRMTNVKKQIPDSIFSELNEFLSRCKKYYQDKTLPTWVSDFDVLVAEREMLSESN